MNAADVEVQAFSVVEFLTALDRGAVADHSVLEALARKVEVARRVHERYDAGLRAPVSEAILAASWVPALGAAFLDAAERTGDLKWLNSALKLQDGVLREPLFTGHPALEERIARLLAVPLPPCEQ